MFPVRVSLYVNLIHSALCITYYNYSGIHLLILLYSQKLLSFNFYRLCKVLFVNNYKFISSFMMFSL